MRQPDQFDMQGRTAIKNVDPFSRYSILFPFPPLVHFHPHGRAIAHVGLTSRITQTVPLISCAFTLNRRKNQRNCCRNPNPQDGTQSPL